LLLETFDAAEFLNFRLNAVEVVKFIFFMSLTQNCHLQVFSYLVTKRGALLDELRNKDSELIAILLKSDKKKELLQAILENHPDIFSLQVIEVLFQNGLISSHQYKLSIHRFSRLYLILFKIWTISISSISIFDKNLSNGT